MGMDKFHTRACHMRGPWVGPRSDSRITPLFLGLSPAGASRHLLGVCDAACARRGFFMD